MVTRRTFLAIGTSAVLVKGEVAAEGVSDVTTSYKTGDRRGRIAVTTTMPISHGSITNWINGSDAPDLSGAFFPQSGSADGYAIVFDWGAPTIVDEARSRQGGASAVLNVSRGNWKWQGWDGTDWIDLTAPFTLGGAQLQVHSGLNGNSEAYSRYRLFGTGGAISDSGWMQEIEFKESTVGAEQYCDPRPNPWPTLTNIRKDIYTVTPPAFNLPMVFSGTPLDYSPPYVLVAESLPILACQPGDVITARWSQEFTNDMATGPEKLCECAGVLTLERLTDSTMPLAIYRAGPTIDYRCMSENRGANVANNPQHHIEITWDGQAKVLVAGDYVVRARAYATPGDNINPVPGANIYVHDGDLIVYRERSGA